jgi:hypothetical protein
LYPMYHADWRSEMRKAVLWCTYHVSNQVIDECTVGTDQVQTSGTYTYRIEEHGVEYVKRATKLEMAIVIAKVQIFLHLWLVGASRDHTASFVQIRQRVVDRTYLEVNRLEKRLTKVVSIVVWLTYSFWRWWQTHQNKRLRLPGFSDPWPAEAKTNNVF